VELLLPTFLAWAPDGDEWSVWQSDVKYILVPTGWLVGWRQSRTAYVDETESLPALKWRQVIHPVSELVGEMFF